MKDINRPASESERCNAMLTLKGSLGAMMSEVAQVVREYGDAFRGNWGDIDGRTVKAQMNYVADWVEHPETFPGLDRARFLLGLCLCNASWFDRHPHWEGYECRQVKAGSDDEPHTNRPYSVTGVAGSRPSESTQTPHTHTERH